MDATLVTMGAAPIKGSSAMAGDEAVLAQGGTPVWMRVLQKRGLPAPKPFGVERPTR